MKFKPVHLIEQKVLKTIKTLIYSEGIRSLQDYISSPKFIPQDGRMHGHVNVNDIKLRLDAIQHNVWSIGPTEFFLDHLQHYWKIEGEGEGDGLWLRNTSYSAAEPIGPFKSRYDAAVYGVNMLMKEE